MKHRLLVACGLLTWLMTSKTWAENNFDQQVLEAILNNPEVVLLAIEKLEAERRAQESVAEGAMIAEVEEALFGNDPSVQLVEFFDYRCSYCARSAAQMQTLPLNLTGRVRHLEFPILGEQSTELAKLSVAVRNVAGQAAYRRFHEAVFASAGRVGNSDAGLRLIDELGFDRDAIEAEANGEAVAAELLRNQRLAARLGISGTPTFVGRDQIYGGLLSPEELVEILNQEQEITQ